MNEIKSKCIFNRENSENKINFIIAYNTIKNLKKKRLPCKNIEDVTEQQRVIIIRIGCLQHLNRHSSSILLFQRYFFYVDTPQIEKRFI